VFFVGVCSVSILIAYPVLPCYRERVASMPRNWSWPVADALLPGRFRKRAPPSSPSPRNQLVAAASPEGVWAWQLRASARSALLTYGDIGEVNPGTYSDPTWAGPSTKRRPWAPPFSPAPLTSLLWHPLAHEPSKESPGMFFSDAFS